MNTAIVERSILHHTNRERRKYGLRRLRGNRRLISAARKHALWCARHRRMQHEGPGNTMPWDRAKEMGYPGYASENMWQQYGRNNTTYGSRFRWRGDWQFGKAAVIAWLNSPGHRQNLLDPSWTEIGIGVSRHHGCTMLVQMFGDNSPAKASETAATGLVYLVGLLGIPAAIWALWFALEWVF